MDNNPFAELRRRDPPQDGASSSNRQATPKENPENASSVPSTPIVSGYTSANDYAMAVRAWLWAYQTWHMSQFLTPLYVQQFLLQQHQRLSIGNGPQIGPVIVPGITTVVTTTRFPQDTQVPDTDTRTWPFHVLQGRRYVIPTFGRRILAEAIDFIICFIFSLFITYILVEIEVIELSRYEKLLSDQADLKTLIDVTQDLFPIEVGKKIVTSILEALFTAYGFSNSVPAGSTPGKFLMGLKIVRCASVTAIAPRDYRVMVYADSENVSFPRALVRSMVKNFSLGFLFPLCVTMYVFQYNRALYDITAGTIVVEA